MERGMAGADTALLAQEAFGLQVEHARYLTLHDLCALMAMQYDHAGLAPLWPVLETALLSRDREAWLDAPPEPLLRYADREARIALLPPSGWRSEEHTSELQSLMGITYAVFCIKKIHLALYKKTKPHK